MVGPSARSAKSVYPLVSKSRVGNWIMIAMLLIAVLATFLAPRKDKFVVTVGVACFLLVGMSALTVWVLRRPNERIETDEEGIAAFDEGNKEVCRIGWKEVTSYGSDLDPKDPKRVEMVLKGSGGQIRFRVSLPGFTRLNNSILSHLPTGIVPSKADFRSLLPAGGQDSAAGNRRFGRIGLLPWVLLLLVIGFGSLFYKDPKSGPIPIALLWVPALFLGLGLPGLVAVINERYIVTADGIAYYNWLGRKKAEIAWKDVVAFEFKRKVGGKGGPTYYYTLVGKDNHIDLDTLITQWKDLAKIILTRMPQEATVDLGPYSFPV